MLWMSWGQLSGKAPKARDPDGWVWPTRAVRTFAAFAGMFAFSLIVGFIKSALKVHHQIIIRSRLLMMINDY